MQVALIVAPGGCFLIAGVCIIVCLSTPSTPCAHAYGCTMAVLIYLMKDNMKNFLGRFINGVMECITLHDVENLTNCTK